MTKNENEDMHLNRPNDAALNRLIENVEQTGRGLQATMLIVHDFVVSDEFKQVVAPLFSNLDAEIRFLANLADNKDIVLPHLAEDLQAFNGGKRMTLREFFESEDENGLTPYEVILRERGKDAVSKGPEQTVIKLLGSKPDSLTMGVSKLHRYMFDGHPDHDLSFWRPLKIGEKKVPGKRRKEPVSIHAAVALVDHNGDLVQRNFSPFVGEVLNGYLSLTIRGQYHFTLSQLYEEFAGKDTTSPEMLFNVERALRILRTSLLSMDWQKQAELYGLDLTQEETRFLEDNIIHIEPALMEVNGKVVWGYHTLVEPSILRYGSAIKQLALIENRKLLDVGLNNTTDNIVIKNWLLRRIEGIRNPNSKMRNPIVLDTLFNECGMELDRTQRKRKIDSIYTMLDSWKGKEGGIKDYTPNKDNRGSVISIHIHL